MIDDRRAGLARAGDDVDHAFGQFRLLKNLRQPQRVRLVVFEGLRTTVLPQASAGAIFHAAMSSGKFHGMIWPATPSGRGFRPGNAYFNLSAQPA